MRNAVGLPTSIVEVVLGVVARGCREGLGLLGLGRG
jgi:hypothetical protein